MTETRTVVKHRRQTHQALSLTTARDLRFGMCARISQSNIHPCGSCGSDVMSVPTVRFMSAVRTTVEAYLAQAGSPYSRSASSAAAMVRKTPSV